MNKDSTICIILTDLYRRAREDQKEELEECFVMAKKMNRRLSELNHLEISPREVEEVWREEIRKA